MQKKDLRQQMLTQRLALSPTEVEARSQQVADRFFNDFPKNGLKTVHIFLPILKHNEINTWFIIKKLWADFPEVQVVVPVTNAAEGTLLHYPIRHDSVLLENRWGIPEPEATTPVPETEIDLVLLPLLAFDELGHRVGYGKGFYDRFLSKCRQNVQKTGLSLFPPVPKIIDIHEADVPLNACITPEKVYQFG